MATYLRTIGVPVIANGNIGCRHDLRDTTLATLPCVGVMSAEGALKNPGLFNVYNRNQITYGVVVDDSSHSGGTVSRANMFNSLNCDDSNEEEDIEECRPACAICENNSNEGKTNMYALYNEYCDLSKAYQEAGGWSAMDVYEGRNVTRDGNFIESKQIYIARQHLTWMLGKSGHGRLVRFKHKEDAYDKHTTLLRHLNEATTIDDLRVIARTCLNDVWA